MTHLHKRSTFVFRLNSRVLLISAAMFLFLWPTYGQTPKFIPQRFFCGVDRGIQYVNEERTFLAARWERYESVEAANVEFNTIRMRSSDSFFRLEEFETKNGQLYHRMALKVDLELNPPKVTTFLICYLRGDEIRFIFSPSLELASEFETTGLFDQESEKGS